MNGNIVRSFSNVNSLSFHIRLDSMESGVYAVQVATAAACLFAVAFAGLWWAQDFAQKRLVTAGLAEGEAKGKIVGKVEVAKNLLRLGLANETIAQATGLSGAEIESLRNE